MHKSNFFKMFIKSIGKLFAQLSFLELESVPQKNTAKLLN